MKKYFLVVLLISVPLVLCSQGNYQQFFSQSMTTNNAGMAVLGGWAVANLTTGAVGWSRTTGQTKYFHQMNFFWNTVNLGIAGYSLYTATQMQPLRMSSQELIDHHIRYENLYLINAGLDIAYMGTGFLLRHLSTRNIQKADMLRGYGNSVILQGGFLFLFDGVMYLLQHNHRVKFLEDMRFTLLSDGAFLHYTFNIQ
ncbi:MAG: hypothetical protein K9G38_06865 [Bacteroidales bacterium]|nr:hypothetical protein [Bacteroidales bacterium]